MDNFSFNAVIPNGSDPFKPKVIDCSEICREAVNLFDFKARVSIIIVVVFFIALFTYVYFNKELSPQTKNILEYASVLGFIFSFYVLLNVYGLML